MEEIDGRKIMNIHYEVFPGDVIAGKVTLENGRMLPFKENSLLLKDKEEKITEVEYIIFSQGGTLAGKLKLVDDRKVLFKDNALIEEIRGKKIMDVAPQVAESLKQIEDMMNRVLIQAGEVSSYEPYVSTDREADQILREASVLASQKMKSSFPDIPESLRQQIEETSSG
ncbi:MAG: hypothetical protein FGF50_09435 [Candidatus Brockarchaeota archaeon]|nr:hypothetical protein [Candidatus Brockarchaeota archaeon]